MKINRYIGFVLCTFIIISCEMDDQFRGFEITMNNGEVVKIFASEIEIVKSEDFSSAVILNNAKFLKIKNEPISKVVLENTESRTELELISVYASYLANKPFILVNESNSLMTYSDEKDNIIWVGDSSALASLK